MQPVIISKQKSILYVDDDEDDLALFQQAVNNVGKGYQILEAFDGIHALEMLEQLQEIGELPCLIVLDINMPRMDGKQTLIALQRDAVLASIPVVLFSTSSSPLDKMFSETKNVELITKPFNIETLYKITNELLSYCKV